jgi:[ribosomal protein S5]-alanine N-acetyltransferase
VTSFDLSKFEAPLKVPELRNGPAHLRPWSLSDLPLIRQAASDPYIPAITSVPVTYSDDEGRAYIERQHGLANGGHGYPFVIGHESNPTTGVGAVALWLREIENGRATIGYWIAPSARGNNIAGWALREMVAFAFEELGIPRLQLFIEPWNVASQKTAEFAGFNHEALLHGWERIGDMQRDAYSYCLLRQEWSSPLEVEHGSE